MPEERPLTIFDIIGKAMKPLKDVGKGLAGFYTSLSKFPATFYTSTGTRGDLGSDIKEAEARLTGKVMPKTKVTEKKVVTAKVSPEAPQKGKKITLKELRERVGIKPEVKEEAKEEKGVKDYYKEFLLSTLEERKELLDDIKEYSKKLEEASKDVKGAIDKIKRELEEIPKLPDLPEMPTPPKKLDTWKKLSGHTKGLLSLVMLAITIKGIAEGIPEAGIIAWGGMLDAIRKRDIEDFEVKMKEYKASLEMIRLETERIVKEYEWKLKEWQMTKYDPLKLELEEKKLDYEMAKYAYEQATKQLEDLNEIIRDTYKNIFEAEKFEWEKFKDLMELQLKAEELPSEIGEREARRKYYETRAEQIKKGGLGLEGILSPEALETLQEAIRNRTGGE